MNANDFTYLLNNPTAVSQQQELLLDKIVAEFPYFQSARALQLKVLHNQNSFRYNQSLKVTAAHTTDRNVLFEFITSEDFAVLKTNSSQKVQTVSETISIAESPEKITQIFDIPVEKAPEPVFSPEATELSEDKIESLLDTINIAGGPDKMIQISHIPVENISGKSILTSETETEPTKEMAETVSETISVADSSDNIFQVSFIPVEKKAETAPTIIEAEPTEEPVETVSESISIGDSSDHIIQISHIPVEELSDSISTSQIETGPIEEIIETVSETISIADITGNVIQISHVAVEKLSELTSIEETQLSEDIIEAEVFEESEVGKKINKLEQSILSSISVATPVTEKFEEKIDSKLEQSILSSISEATAAIEEIRNEKKGSKLEQSILDPITVATPVAEEVASEIVQEIPVNEKAKEPSLEEKLEIGQPLDFSKQEKHSFSEWLQLASLKPIQRAETIETSETKKKEIEPIIEQKIIEPEVEQNHIELEIKKKNKEEDEVKKKKLALIDKFIEENPKITPAKNAPLTTFVIEQQPPIENSYLMTETLAKVYLEQKKYQKAIQAYEILILKYPEKISFFANRIADIKALQQNNN